MKVLVTGATGFIGSFLSYELLKKNYKIFFLARTGKDKSAKQRIRETLEFIGPSLQYQDQYEIIEGDITKPNLGINDVERFRNEIDAVWHCAASIKFREEEKKTTEKINIDGTRNVLEFMKEMQIFRLHYLSTAYVAGDRTGQIYENELDYGQNFRNPYEQTKFETEKMIKQFEMENNLKASIYRLSIVIGDSIKGRSLTFTGYYGYFLPFWLSKQTIHKKFIPNSTFYENCKRAGIEIENKKLNLPVIIKQSSQSDLNLVPVDWVAKTLTLLGESPDSIGKTFHLVHTNPPNVEWIIKTSLKILGIEGYKLTDDVKTIIHSNRLLQQFQKNIDEVIRQYFPYTKYGPHFDNSNVRKVLGNSYKPPKQINEDFLRILLRYAIKKNFGKKTKKRLRRSFESVPVFANA